MKLNINHKTTYRYNEAISYGLQQVRLFPKTRTSQKPLDWSIEIEGGKREVKFEDQHNNRVLLISALPGVEEVTISAHGSVETTDTAGIIGKIGGYAPLWYFLGDTQFTKPGELVHNLVNSLGAFDKVEISLLHDLSSKIRETVDYEVGATDISTTAEDAMALGRGVCQDHAHIFLGAAHMLGVPARYVSGYLMVDGQVDQDATHAWVEAYVEGLGWVGFDVSNVISPDLRYVAVATGLDYFETAPVSGMRFGNSDETLVVSLQVQQ